MAGFRTSSEEHPPEQRVLVVEDEAAIRDMIGFALKRAELVPMPSRRCARGPTGHRRAPAGPDPARLDVAVRAVLAAVLHDAAGLSAGRHRISLECTSEADLKGSAKDLHSAFGNLASNAVRHTPDEGSIRLRWAAHAQGAAFSVSDTGQGIPAQHLPRLSERLYRVSTS